MEPSPGCSLCPSVCSQVVTMNKSKEQEQKHFTLEKPWPFNPSFPGENGLCSNIASEPVILNTPMKQTLMSPYMCELHRR